MSFGELERKSPQVGEHGDTNMYLLRTGARIRYGLVDNLEASIDAGYLRLEADNTISDVHHRDEILDGLGDMSTSIKYFFYSEKELQFSGIVGTTIPTGRRNKVGRWAWVDEKEAEEAGIDIPEHSHLQLGTGTFVPSLGLDGLYRFSNSAMLYSIFTVNIPFYENRDGYLTAPSFRFSLAPALQLSETFVLALDLKTFYSGRDNFSGSDLVGTNSTIKGDKRVPNTGRFEFSAGPSFVWGINERLTFNAQISVPIYTDIRQGSEKRDVQLTEPIGITAGISYKF